MDWSGCFWMLLLVDIHSVFWPSGRRRRRRTRWSVRQIGTRGSASQVRIQEVREKIRTEKDPVHGRPVLKPGPAAAPHLLSLHRLLRDRESNLKCVGGFTVPSSYQKFSTSFSFRKPKNRTEIFFTKVNKIINNFWLNDGTEKPQTY